MHFAALVRTVLSRKQASQPKKRKFAKFGVDPGTWSYHFCRKFPDNCNRQGFVLEGLDALLNIFYLYRDGSFTKQNESIWLIQDPESAKDWFPFFRWGISGPFLARGYLAGRVIKIGPTYKSYVADPNNIVLWTRDTINAVSSNPSLLRQGAVLNKKLMAILGNPEEFKVRNFIRFRCHHPNSYQESRIFLGLDANNSLIMDLVPEDTPPDARLIQFWNTDAALVVMPQANRVGSSIAPAATIGRAGIVHFDSFNDLPSWDRPIELTPFLPTSNLSYPIPINTDMLTELSFDTVIQPGTSGGFEYSSRHSPRHWAFDF